MQAGGRGETLGHALRHAARLVAGDEPQLVGWRCLGRIVQGLRRSDAGCLFRRGKRLGGRDGLGLETAFLVFHGRRRRSVGIDHRHAAVLPLVAVIAHAETAVDPLHVGHAPAHARGLGLLDGLHIVFVLHDVRGHDDQQFLADHRRRVVAEEVAQDRDLRQQRHAALDLVLGLGHQTAEDHGLAVQGADRGRGLRGLDLGGLDHLAIGEQGHGDAVVGIADFGLFGVDLHDDQSVGTDARGDAEDQAHVFQLDIVDLAGGRDLAAGDARDALAHQDEGGLVVEGHDLRPAEDVQALALLQGAQQDADAFAGGGEDQAAVAQFVVDAAHAEVGQALAADHIGAVERLRAATVSQRTAIVEVVPRYVCGGDHLLRNRRNTTGRRCVRALKLDIPQHATIEENRILQAQFDAELVVVTQFDLGDKDLDHDHAGALVELLDEGLDLVEETRGGADDQAVADRFRDHDHLALDLFEGADQTRAELLHLALGLEELVDGLGDAGGRGVLEPVDNALAVPDLGFVEAQEDGLDHIQVAGGTGDDDAVGAHIHGEPQGNQAALFGAGAGRGRGLEHSTHHAGKPALRAGSALTAARGGLAEEGLQHFHQGQHVGVDDGEDLELGIGGGMAVEFVDQGPDEFHALGRGGDDQGIGARVGRDAHVAEDARAEQALPLGVDGEEAEHQGLGVACGALAGGCRGARLGRHLAGRAGAGHAGEGGLLGHGLGGLLAGALSGLAGALPRRLPGDGILQDGGHLGGQGVLQFEDAQVVGGLALGHVDALDQGLDFGHIARAGLDDERIGAILGRDAGPGGEAGARAEEFLDGGGGLRGRGVAQGEDAELVLGRNRLVQTPHQFDGRAHILDATDQQQGIGLDQRGDGHAAQARGVDGAVDLVDQGGDGLAIGLLHGVDFDHRLGLGAEPFDLLDDLHDLVHVALVAAHDEHVQAFQHFDLHGADQAAGIGVRAARLGLGAFGLAGLGRTLEEHRQAGARILGRRGRGFVRCGTGLIGGLDGGHGALRVGGARGLQRNELRAAILGRSARGVQGANQSLAALGQGARSLDRDLARGVFDRDVDGLAFAGRDAKRRDTGRGALHGRDPRPQRFDQGLGDLLRGDELQRDPLLVCGVRRLARGRRGRRARLRGVGRAAQEPGDLRLHLGRSEDQNLLGARIGGHADPSIGHLVAQPGSRVGHIA